MRYLLYFVLASVLIMSSCSNNYDTLETEDLSAENDPIIGKWKLVEAYISSGGPQYWVNIENGEEFTFTSNGLFSSNRFSECTNGDFSIESNELILNYSCNEFTTGFENPEGAITYKITFESNYILLTPTSVICFEGCSYKYVRK
ncbi:hypothetical protein BC962_3283 [Gillisia mitskevichiae]|uniref:Lipocalin-like protein n=1 Tax=Gillisia mitskevichiae TaxID=270921 RepID=A0A495NVQ9_9FLAO|nr:hypothetical protein [Gillisia mitskevichiae]RKS42494.1 hypothetical protein BC962_3283 [Gillisia mitskevichiae]